MNARDDRTAHAPVEMPDEKPAAAGDEPRAEPPAARKSTDRITFEGIRELVAKVPPAPQEPQDTQAPEGGQGALLDSIRITCQAGGVAHNGAYCRQCARFVNWVPSPDRSEVTIRCLWSEGDLAGDLMACTSALVTIGPDTPMREAAAVARSLETPYLLVESEGHFEGVIYQQDMVEEGRVRDRMIRPAWSVSPSVTLGDVVEVMLAHGTDFVPVVADGALLGVITRADLVGAGLEAVLGPPPR